MKGSPGKAALALRELEDVDIGLLAELAGLDAQEWMTNDARPWCRLERLGCVKIKADNFGTSVEATAFGLEVLERAEKRAAQ